MFALIEDALGESADYVEIRIHQRRSRSCSAEDGVLEVAKTGQYFGAGVRVLVDGTWGFSSTDVVDKAGLRRAIDLARRGARAASESKRVRIKGLANANLARTSLRVEQTRPVTDLSFADKIALVLDTERRIGKAHSLICSSSATYAELIDEKWIVTSDGARLHSVDVKPEFRAGAVAEDGDQLFSCSEAEGHTGGLGELFVHRNAEEMADRAAKTAVDLLKAPTLDGGSKTVIMTPAVVGLLIHEAIGHTVEADFVLSGSAAAGRIGQRVADERITMRDSGMSERAPGAGGVVLVDDEGVPSQRVTIIEDGILKSYLHNRETAAIFDVEPTGNARAFEYDDEPIIRMRNTYLEPREGTLDEIIDDTQDGVLLMGAQNGQADANAEFMFAVAETYPIKNGKLGPLHRGATITGNAFDVLTSVDRVGGEFRWDLGSGFCGKGQPAKVDAGGPPIRCQVMLAGSGE